MEIEMYMWMALGIVCVAYLGRIYWNIYQGWRAWSQTEAVRQGDLVAPPAKAAAQIVTDRALA